MEVRISASELMDRGLWEEACEELGLNIYAVNEGQRDPDEEITLTEEQAIRIGLFRASLGAYTGLLEEERWSR